MRRFGPLSFRMHRILPALSLIFAASAIPAYAADAYPTKPVRLIAPFPTGSSVDIVGRMVASRLTEQLGKQVIVDNRGGGGGTIGAALAARATPDGYTFLVINAAHTTTPAIHKALPYDPVASFIPIAKLGSGPSILVVHPGVQAQSVKELIALAKAKPGQLILAVSGTGSNQHLSAELFRVKAGITLNMVQFTGGGAMMTDLVGGHSHMTISVGSLALPHIGSGRLRALGVGSKRRIALLPDVPAIAETLPGYEAGGWWGFLAPAGTPKPIVDRIGRELKTIASTEEMRKFFLHEAAEVDYVESAGFGAFIAGQIAQWKQVVREANIRTN